MGDNQRHLGKRHVCRHKRREARRTSAIKRAEERAKRNWDEQLRLLDTRPGSSVRERNRSEK